MENEVSVKANVRSALCRNYRPHRYAPAAWPQIAGGGAVRRILGRAGGRRRHGHRRERGDGSAQGGVRGEHCVVAMAVHARRWHQRGNLLSISAAGVSTEARGPTGQGLGIS